MADLRGHSCSWQAAQDTGRYTRPNAVQGLPGSGGLHELNSIEQRAAVPPPWLYLLISVRTHEYFIVWLITHYRFEVVTRAQ